MAWDAGDVGGDYEVGEEWFELLKRCGSLLVAHAKAGGVVKIK